MSSIILGCPTIQYELKQAMTDAHCDIPVYFIPQQLHNSPPALQKYLQRAIDSLWNVDRIIYVYLPVVVVPLVSHHLLQSSSSHAHETA